MYCIQIIIIYINLIYEIALYTYNKNVFQLTYFKKITNNYYNCLYKIHKNANCC